MELKNRVAKLEKELGISGNPKDAKNYVDLLLMFEIIKPEDYDKNLNEIIESGVNTKQVIKNILKSINGETLGLPSEQEMREGKNGSNKGLSFNE